MKMPRKTLTSQTPSKKGCIQSIAFNVTHVAGASKTDALQLLLSKAFGKAVICEQEGEGYVAHLVGVQPDGIDVMQGTGATEYEALADMHRNNATVFELPPL